LLCEPYTQLDAKDKRNKIRKNAIHGMKLAFLSMFFHPLPKGSPWFTVTPKYILPQDCFVKEQV
jgi:hypothetical protein